MAPTLARCLILGLILLALPTRADEPAEDFAPPESFTDEQLDHWAYHPLGRPTPPAVEEAAWIRNPIDRFILAQIEDFGFQHAPEADRVALIRRVTYDLTGLPPSPEEVAAFLTDDRPDAYERVVDRLLASPRYGERWAQHWLDLAHYADSNGFELDAERPDAWRYRDWVVNALNDDMPYDRFVLLQLAGDEAEPGRTEALIATGFGRCGPREVVGGNIDPAVKRQSELTEITGTVGSVFLGLTMGCARCHDHKFDAIPSADYYRLQAFFAGAEMVDVPIASKEEEAAFEQAKKVIDEQVAPLKAAQAELEKPYREALRERKQAMLTEAERSVLAIPEDQRTPVQKKMAEGANKALHVTWEEVAEAVRANPEDHAKREELKRAIDAIERMMPPPPAKAMALVEQEPEIPATFVLHRGDPKNRGPRVRPRPPGVILTAQRSESFPEAPTEAKPSSGRRLELARWLTRDSNPLTARVIVNRLWQHHFGRGIVATPSDFGVRGEPPSHPLLLDWLALRLIDEGWRLKPIHRLMVTSSAYRQASSFAHDQQEADDPDNLLLWRMNRRRLDAEGLRDALLFVSGDLNDKGGGPGVKVPIEPEIEELIFTEAEVVDLWPETPDPAAHLRRSLYLFRKRNVRYPMFDAFDAPDTQTACARRGESTHAPQALVLLNGAFALDRARSLAQRLFRVCPGDEAERIQRAYRIVLGREPRSFEIEQARAFLEDQAAFLSTQGTEVAPPACEGHDVSRFEVAAWVDFARAMLNRNEFVYIP